MNTVQQPKAESARRNNIPFSREGGKLVKGDGRQSER